MNPKFEFNVLIVKFHFYKITRKALLMQSNFLLKIVGKIQNSILKNCKTTDKIIMDIREVRKQF